VKVSILVHWVQRNCAGLKTTYSMLATLPWKRQVTGNSKINNVLFFWLRKVYHIVTEAVSCERYAVFVTFFECLDIHFVIVNVLAFIQFFHTAYWTLEMGCGLIKTSLCWVSSFSCQYDTIYFCCWALEPAVWRPQLLIDICCRCQHSAANLPVVVAAVNW